MIYKSEEIKDLASALDKAQNEFDPVLKDSKNPLYNSKYADLDGVLSATQPTLSKNNLVISQPPISDLGVKGVGVSTILIHTTSGQYIGSDLLLPAVGHGKDKTERYDAQTGCAAITYARRNAYLAILGISSTDDDGNAASGQKQAEQTKTATQTTRPNNPPKTAPAGPPKAEIPNETKQSSGSNTSTASVSDPSLPNVEEYNGYRVRFGKLVDALSTAGLKPSKGFPIQNKVKAYLFQETGVDNPEKISKGAWEGFFEQVGKISNGESGISKLVELVNSSVGGTN